LELGTRDVANRRDVTSGCLSEYLVEDNGHLSKCDKMTGRQTEKCTDLRTDTSFRRIEDTSELKY